MYERSAEAYVIDFSAFYLYNVTEITSKILTIIDNEHHQRKYI